MSDGFQGQDVRSKDRRAFGRRNSCIHAMLYVPGRPPSPCVVRNFSTAGAHIELGERVEPPFRVKIRLTVDGPDIDCEVRHVRGLRMGVSFVSEGVAEALAQALGAVVRRRKTRVLPQPGSMPRISGSDLRRVIFRPKAVRYRQAPRLTCGPIASRDGIVGEGLAWRLGAKSKRDTGARCPPKPTVRKFPASADGSTSRPPLA